MKIGLRLYGVEPDGLVATAQRAEKLGYESIWRGEHLVLPTSLEGERYPYTPDGVPPLDTRAPVLDTLVVFSYLAAATERIRLATGIYILPLRNPIVTARAVLTLDVLSRGRVTFGIGIGWMRGEFAAVGEDFRTRAARTEEAIALLKSLWTEPETRFEGTFYDVGPIHFEPKPVQKPHPPIVMGGETDAALSRAARLADGWYGHVKSPEDVAAIADRLRSARVELGREGPFEVTIRVAPEASLDDVRRYEEAGVDRLVLELSSFNARGVEGNADIDRFADRVLAAL